MRRKIKKFQLRLEPGEYRAMMIVANRRQLSMSAFLVNYIRQEAKKEKIKL